MALFQKYVKDKVVRDIAVQEIPDLFRRSGFNPNSELFKAIQDVITENDVNVGVILDSPVSELIEDFKLVQNDDKRNFVRMRVVLRKADFQKREKIAMSFSAVQDLNWDQICQLFEQELRAKDMNQSEIWYTYFEEEGIRGSNMPTMNLAILAKELQLTGAQKENLETLLEKIQPEEPEPRRGHVMLADHAALGVMSIGGSLTTGAISVTRSN